MSTTHRPTQAGVGRSAARTRSWRIATAGDPGTGYTFTSGGSTYAGASVMLAFRGVDQVQPFDSHTGVTYIKQDILTAPSITTSVANTRLLTLHFHEEGTDRGNTITPDPAMTEIYEDWSLSRTIEVAQQSIAGTGAMPPYRRSRFW